MARPKTFSPDDALDDALGVFRRRGYEATSVQDLSEATGLSRSSLYATFGSKHALYLAALDRYRASGRALLADALACGSGASPVRAIRLHLEAVAAERGEDGAPPIGCLMTNAAAEVASRDPETARRTAEAADHLASAFEAAVARAQALGEVSPERDALALGRFLAGTVYGVRGLQKAGASADTLGDVVATAMQAVNG